MKEETEQKKNKKTPILSTIATTTTAKDVTIKQVKETNFVIIAIVNTIHLPSYCFAHAGSIESIVDNKIDNRKVFAAATH